MDFTPSLLRGKVLLGPPHRTTGHPLSVRCVLTVDRHTCLPEGEQDVIYPMTCSPLSAPEDLKVLIREGISKLSPPDLIQSPYEALRFFLIPRGTSTTGLYLLVGLQVTFEVHMRLRDVLLC
jgi:hypothetical protein